MVISLLVEVFIKAFLLCILIYIVARDEADYEFRKVSMVTAGIVALFRGNQWKLFPVERFQNNVHLVRAPMICPP